MPTGMDPSLTFFDTTGGESREDGGEDNERSGHDGAPAIFFCFFKCLTRRGRNAGRVRPSPPLFYATKGGPSPSCTCFGEGTPFPLVSRATRRGSSPPRVFSSPTGRVDSSVPIFDTTRGGSTPPHHFRHNTGGQKPSPLVLRTTGSALIFEGVGVSSPPPPSPSFETERTRSFSREVQ